MYYHVCLSYSTTYRNSEIHICCLYLVDVFYSDYSYLGCVFGITTCRKTFLKCSKKIETSLQLSMASFGPVRDDVISNPGHF